jgi:hypothetical protein
MDEKQRVAIKALESAWSGLRHRCDELQTSNDVYKQGNMLLEDEADDMERELKSVRDRRNELRARCRNWKLIVGIWEAQLPDVHAYREPTRYHVRERALPCRILVEEAIAVVVSDFADYFTRT